jgi:hypothetical protein
LLAHKGHLAALVFLLECSQLLAPVFVEIELLATPAMQDRFEAHSLCNSVMIDSFLLLLHGASRQQKRTPSPFGESVRY